MLDLTFSMRDALAVLLAGDAELGGDHWRRTYRMPGGQVIDGQTVKALAKRALARTHGSHGQTFTLTAAGRRRALALQTGTAS